MQAIAINARRRRNLRTVRRADLRGVPLESIGLARLALMRTLSRRLMRGKGPRKSPQKFFPLAACHMLFSTHKRACFFFLDFCIDNGRPNMIQCLHKIKKGPSKMAYTKDKRLSLNIRVSDCEYGYIKRRSALLGRTMSQYLRDLVQADILKNGSPYRLGELPNK